MAEMNTVTISSEEYGSLITAMVKFNIIKDMIKKEVEASLKSGMSSMFVTSQPLMDVAGIKVEGVEV